MKIIRGRGDARWLPSRHNFALFRLLAYVRCRAAAPEPAPVILVVDRHQSALEYYTVSAWIFATMTCALAATLFARLPVAAALLVAMPAAAIVLESPLFLLGLLFAPLDGVRTIRGQSLTQLGMYLAGAAWLTTRPSWARYVGWQFVGIAALNALAACIVFLLRRRIHELETSFDGGPASAL